MTQFTEKQIESLKAPLSRDKVKTREQGKSTLSYIEAWHAIDEANQIFGFDAWDREIKDCRCVMERERKIGQGQYQRDGWGVTYTATVRIKVGTIIREGTGAGHGIDADLGLAHESAIKEAESDAMKRALVTFGNPFGLALYDKTQANVEGVPQANNASNHDTQRKNSDQSDQARMEPQNQQRSLSKSDARPLYSSLEKSMRENRNTADLAAWWRDPECVAQRAKLPDDWRKNLHGAFVEYGTDLKNKEKRSSDRDSFPGDTTNHREVA